MKKTRFITEAALIGALYVVLCEISAALGLSSSAVQLRFAEALTVLPIFTPSAVPGLFIGCIISNILAGGVIWDVIFGSIATLIGAVATMYLGKINRHLAPVPPIVANSIIVPLVIKYAYGVDTGLFFIFLGVFAGELISCGVFGELLMGFLSKRKNIF